MRAVYGGCMNRHVLEEGQTGLYQARKNTGGAVVPVNCGKIMSIAPGPMKEKPLRRFLPGSVVLSVGSFGCNLRRPFCQNHEISMAGEGDSRAVPVGPKKLAKKVAELRIEENTGVAYIYNEPLVSRGYVKDTGCPVRIAGMKNVIVTSGGVSDQALGGILPVADAMSIDLKGFTEQYYRKLSGDLETVKHFITRPSRQCHVELITLIIPREDNSGEGMREMAGWISSLSPGIPLHVSRFFPRWRMGDRPAADVARVYKLVQIARKYLRYIWTGSC